MTLKTIDLKTACEVLEVEYKMPVFDLPEPLKTRREKDYSRDMINDALHKETNFVPDYSEGNRQYKYEAILWKDASGRWVYINYYSYYRFSSVVPRLVHKDKVTMRHFVDVLIAQDLLD